MNRLASAAIGIAVLIVVVTGAWYLLSPEATKVKAGHMAPDLELPSHGGAVTRLSNYRGRPVLLVFFKSDCHTCRKELPEIEKLHRGRNRDGLTVVGVAVDKDREPLAQFIRDAQITFYVLEDPSGKRIFEAYGSYKMPETYLIDATGRVDSVYLGSVDWKGGPIVDRIQSLLTAWARPSPRPRGER